MGRLRRARNWVFAEFSRAIVTALVSWIFISFATIYMFGKTFDSLTLLERLYVMVVYAILTLIIGSIVVLCVRASLASNEE